MKLSRRDALLALGAMGGGSVLIGSTRRSVGGEFDDDDVVTRLHAVAEAIYPTEIEVDRSFIATYAHGRLESREEYREGQAAALRNLDERSRSLAGLGFSTLSVERRRRVLRRAGIHRAPPVPDGTPEERIRFFVINDLLYAFYTTPTGSDPLGCQNPPGFAGGRDAYRRRRPL